MTERPLQHRDRVLERPSSCAYAASWPSDRATMRLLDCARPRRRLSSCSSLGRARARRGLHTRPRDRRSRARVMLVSQLAESFSTFAEELPRARRDRLPRRSLGEYAPRVRGAPVISELAVDRSASSACSLAVGTSSPSAITAAPRELWHAPPSGGRHVASALSRRRPPSARWPLMTQNRDSAPASCNRAALACGREPVERARRLSCSRSSRPSHSPGSRSSAGSAPLPRRARGSARRGAVGAPRPRPTSRAARPRTRGSSRASRSARSRVTDQALVDERLQGVEVGAGDLLGRLERAAAAEDGEPGEEPLLLLGRAARSSTRSSRAASAGARARRARRPSAAAGAGRAVRGAAPGESALTRAAASSSASGRSSRRRQISGTASSPGSRVRRRARSSQEEADVLVVHERRHRVLLLAA